MVDRTYYTVIMTELVELHGSPTIDTVMVTYIVVFNPPTVIMTEVTELTPTFLPYLSICMTYMVASTSITVRLTEMTDSKKKGCSQQNRNTIKWVL